MCGIRKGSAVLVLFFKPAVMSPKLDLWIPSPNLVSTLPTMQFGHWRKRMKSYVGSQELQKALYYFFTFAVELPKTCKHT